MLLPDFVQSALLGKPITVYGDGDQTRSFTPVRDVVEAITGLMSESAAEGDVFNVGNDKEVTINELAQKVKKMTGTSSPTEHVPFEKTYGPGFEDMRRRCTNIQKMRKLTGFVSKQDLESMIQGVIDYYKE
jgi:UDP-glucose 4-epimerase